MNRRPGDLLRAISKAILFWGGLFTALAAVGVAFAYAATTFVRTKDAVEVVPVITARVDAIENRQDSQQEREDERWERLEWWMAAVGKKLDIPSPPVRRRRRDTAPRPD